MSARGVAKLVGTLLLSALAALSGPDAADALGVIETPSASGTESGISVFSGWHCGAEKIEIRIDGGQPMRAGSGTPRGDTASVCGRTDTGWSLLYNFSLLDGSVKHEAVAYADGSEFARVEFRTTNLGVDFLRDRSASCVVRNFPELGEGLTLNWNEERQNFSITSIGLRPDGPPPTGLISGTYYGGVSVHGPPPIVAKPAVFTVELTDSTLSVSIERVGRGTCRLSVPWRLEGSSATAIGRDDASTCISGGPFFLRVDGKTIHGGVFDLGGLLFEGIKLQS